MGGSWRGHITLGVLSSVRAKGLTAGSREAHVCDSVENLSVTLPLSQEGMSLTLSVLDQGILSKAFNLLHELKLLAPSPLTPGTTYSPSLGLDFPHLYNGDKCQPRASLMNEIMQIEYLINMVPPPSPNPWFTSGLIGAD